MYILGDAFPPHLAVLDPEKNKFERLIFPTKITKHFRYLNWRYSPIYKAILGVGFPLHKPYILLI